MYLTTPCINKNTERNMQVEQWKTIIDLQLMNLIIFLLSVQALSINCGFPLFSLLVARLLQPALPAGLGTKVALILIVTLVE